MRLLRLWPLGLFVIATILNTDAMILNHQWLQSRFSLSLEQLCLWVVAVSVAELYFEYWFFGWCGRGAAREGPAIWPKIIDWLYRRAGRLGMRYRLEAAVQASLRAWEMVRVPIAAILRALDWRNHLLIKRGGYPALGILSLAPIFGCRTGALLIQRAARLPWGVTLIAICSGLRVAYMLYGLAILIWLPFWAKGLVILTAGIGLLVWWRRTRRS